MKRPVRPILYWTPRVLGILFALFISLFAMDVFQEGYTLPELLVALLMHMIPTLIVVIALVLAWRWEWIGAIVFLGLAVFYIVWTWGRFLIGAYLGISGPLVIIGILFFFNWLLSRKIHPPDPEVDTL